MLVQWLGFPLSIKWYITGKCNLRCKHCYLTDYTVQSPLEQVSQFIDYFSQMGVHGIAFLGGEPLVRKDLEDILKMVSNQNIRSKIATNGTLITKDRAKSLVASGCKQYQISLEGHSPELSDPVRGKATFEKAITGVQNLKEQGAWASFGVTITKQNALYIQQIHQLAREVGVDQLKIGGFVPIGTGKNHTEEYNLTREIVLDVRRELMDLQQRFPKLQIDSKFLPPKNSNCASDCTFGCGAGTTSLVVNSDLTLSACDMLVEEDRTKVKVNSPEEIEDLWNNNPLFNKWRGLAPNEITRSVNSFEKVHQEGCHIAYSAYEDNLFRI
ncbi:radical SAM protein [Bacillus cereus]|nr:radical SAM protein [Bacillus cereus]